MIEYVPPMLGCLFVVLGYYSVYSMGYTDGYETVLNELKRLKREIHDKKSRD